MARENQRIMLTKRLLKEALLRLLERSPLNKISITELCHEASINRVTFYRHYEYPKDVLIDIEKDFLEDMSQKFDYKVPHAERLQYFEEMFSYILQHQDLIKIFITNASDADFPKMFQKLYTNNVLKYQQHPLFSGYDPDSVFLISSFYAGGIYFLLKYWLFEDIKKSPQELAKLFVEMSDKQCSIIDSTLVKS